jgi:hypothetical protein
MTEASPVISKSQLARRICVSPGRVSQLLRQGLPERTDGLIDEDAALAWCRFNLNQGRRAEIPGAPSLAANLPNAQFDDLARRHVEGF